MSTSTRNGHYWWGMMSSGRYGVFWTHPRYEEWHCCVATFRDSVRAESYADDCNAQLSPGSPMFEEEADLPADVVQPVENRVAPTASMPEPAPPVLRTRPGFARHETNTPRVTRVARITISGLSKLRPPYEALKADLPKWLAEVSEITAAMVRERYKVTYNDALTLLRAAADEDLGDWVQVRRNNQMGKVFVAKGTVPHSQADEVLSVLRDAADDNRCAELATAAIAARAHVPLGDVTSIIGVLIREGKVMLARPQHGTSPAVYQVLA